MPFYRYEYLREAVSMTLNNTFKLELPDAGKLSALFIRISGSQISGFGASGGDWRIIDKISKVEVLANGSSIVKSITGITGGNAFECLAVFV